MACVVMIKLWTTHKFRSSKPFSTVDKTETMPEHRPIDYLFFGYFLMQIPSTILFDTQGVYFEWFYPQWLRSVKAHYLESYRDPFLADVWQHPWYLSICVVEHLIWIPFFFWAASKYHQGALKQPVVLLPSIIYCTNTMTAVMSVWLMALLSDFSQSEALAPRSFGERLKLCSAYALFFFIPLINLIDSLKLCWERMGLSRDRVSNDHQHQS